MLTAKIRGVFTGPDWLPDAMFDLNNDANINRDDHRVWVKDLKHTWFGDANLDGEFNHSDMVQVILLDKYERGWLDEWGQAHGETAGWAAGDWNADLIFDSNDFITAFVDGGYGIGPRKDVAAVPEPDVWLLTVMGLSLCLGKWRLGRHLQLLSGTCRD